MQKKLILHHIYDRLSLRNKNLTKQKLAMRACECSTAQQIVPLAGKDVFCEKNAKKIDFAHFDRAKRGIWCEKDRCGEQKYAIFKILPPFCHK
jgi:hypothetical protein